MNTLSANTRQPSLIVHFLSVSVLLFILWLLPTAVHATYVDETYNYSIIYQAPNKIKMKLPIYDCDGADCWVYDGNVYVTVDGSTKTVLHYAAERDIDNNHTYNDARFSTGVGGKVMILRGVDYGNEVVGTAERVIKIYRPNTRQTYFYVEAEWTVPNEMRGKTLKFSYYVKRDGNSRSDEQVQGLESQQFDISAMQELAIPEMMTPMLAYERANAGNIMVPWMVAAANIQSVTLHYTDSENKQQTSTLKAAASDFVYLPYDKPIRTCYIEVVYLDTEKNERTTKSVPIDLPILHTPKDLTATLQTNGTALLKWTVSDHLYKDVMDADLWEIQRCVGNPISDSDWQSAGQLTYEQGTETYSFVDEMLPSVYQPGSVFYRVRRTSTAMWGWTDAAGMAQTEITHTYYLPYVGTATVTKDTNWGVNDQHSVTLQWKMSNTPISRYDAEGRYILRSPQDWEAFAQMVNGGQPQLNAVMIANLVLDSQTMVGTATNPYRGTFDGNGHTLTVNYQMDVNADMADKDIANHPAAPFAFVGNNAAFKNLHTLGTITTNCKFAGGVVGKVLDEGSSQAFTMENCWSSVTINSTLTGDGTHGGLIGALMNSTANTTYTLKNCLFDGAFIGNTTDSWGGLVGWTYLRNHTYDHCLVAPQKVDVNTNSTFTIVRGYYSPSLSQTYYTQAIGTEQGIQHSVATLKDRQDLLAKLNTDNQGSGWELTESGVVPVMKSVAIVEKEEQDTGDIALWDERAKIELHTQMIAASGQVVRTTQRNLSADEVKAGKASLSLTNTCVDYQFSLVLKRDQSPLYIGLNSREDSYETPARKTEKGDAANYEFNLNGKVTGVSATEQQASVQLNWTTNNLPVDYFRVLRRDKADTTHKVDTLVTNYQQTQYIDTHPQPQHTYIYRVEAVVDCEGQHLTTAETDGHCAPTGMVQGYVRLADGTAVAGATVVAEPVKSSHILNGVTLSTVTDESGFYQIGGLVYQTAGSYDITVTRKGDEGSVGTRTANFTDRSNLTSDLNFFVEDFCIYSGVVLYSGSSIPVLGAQFKLDGQTITKSSGADKGKPVTTNSAGEFSISIPKGAHTVQVVKTGHVFADNGFLINHDAPAGADSTLYNFNKNIYEQHLWDQTRVILRGRVVGGKDQGTLPLGKSLSKNNLGDSIRIVLQLEGDNASWIVRDPKDETVRMRDSLYFHGRTDTTRVVSNRHTIVISPDNKTGEFQVPFIPVKYKVTDIHCNGYATLFQAGKVGETLDLSDAVVGDTITYNRIYHQPATLTYEQFTGTLERYYGIKTYKAQDNLGKDVTVQLWKNNQYSLGHPVFMANSPTLLTLSAREEYYYNNVVKDTPDDIVLLSGGTVYVHNGLISAEHSDSIQLDNEGKASYLFTPQNLTFVNENTDALKSLTFTLLYDQTYYDIPPLKAYVMASQTKSQGKRLIVAGTPHLVDVLRDPPGSTSSAYIQEGSKMKYGYTYDFNLEGGFNLELAQGKGSNFYTGIWAGVGNGTEAGSINRTESNSLFKIAIQMSYYGGWNYAYEMTTSKKIETSSNVKSVGAAADLFIGTTDETVIEEAIAVRVVPESMYKLLVPATGNTFTQGGKEYEVKLGTVKVLAEGKDADGNKVYLIRDEVMQASPRFKSSFVYSKTFIETELLPQLMRARQSLMLPKGTTDDEAKAQATRLKHPVYVSKVAMDDPSYASTDKDGKRTYAQFLPDGTSSAWSDSIAVLNQEMMAWIGFMTANEQEKLSVSDADKVETFSFDGAGKISYEESFDFTLERSNYMKIPGISDGNILGDTFFDNLVKKFNEKKGKETKTTDEDDNVVSVGFMAAGSMMTLTFKPIFTYDFNYKNLKTEGHSKKTGFALACDRQAYLTVDVYRTKVDVSGYKEKIEAGDMAVIYQYSEETKEAIRSGATGTNQALSFMPYDTKTYSNFVFRTKGGATKKPYEDARYTDYYNRGALLDEKTLPIDNLKIWTDQATVSNVPYGQPAKFVIHLANESETPTLVSPYFNLYRAESEDDAKGAKVFVDGVPLNAGGVTVFLGANQVVDKLVEVYAGTEFDYNNLVIGVWDPDDQARMWTQTLSAHFLPSAGAVNISSPGDKWVINTESPYSKEKQQYYMPVRIDGFNVNARGFDHIELQYKLSTESDQSWVNVCSFYKSEELMALATGEKKLIRNDGYIDDAIFYGEKDPVEQHYDLRAVVYCRHADGFITAASPILSGVKDTRVPVPFGTPKPVSGILDIGDDIVISFSEPIAGNYLTRVNNFEVVGTMNSKDVSLSTALRLTGKDSYGLTLANRNLANRSFTFDVMLNPDANGRAMRVLSHGEGANHLDLGMTADRRLVAKFDGRTAVSDKAVDFNGVLHQVAYSFDQSKVGRTVVTFYDGSVEIGRDTLDVGYHGSGAIWLGDDFDEDDEKETVRLEPYEGSMLELRLWNTAMRAAELSKYARKVLTGYELHLIDNYALNEGNGRYCYDKAVGGNDMVVTGTSWVVPDGISLKLDGEKGVKMDSQCFDRQDFEDYTLMFWFRTTDKEGTLMSNGMALDEPNCGMHFFVGVEEGELVFRSAGEVVKTGVGVSDGAWHHFAVTVNRARNVGNVYVDQAIVQSFAVEKFGGIAGDRLLAVGATYTDEVTPTLPLKGNIDEIAMYEMVLPENMIRTYSLATPSGEEMGTLAYLPFSRSERLTDNQMRLMPSGVSLRKYRVNGTVSESRRDTIVADGVVAELADRQNYALLHDGGKMENLAYSFVTDNQQLLLNLDVPEADIEKTNVYVTVKEVADLNGNLTASPVVMNLFVYRNPLRWEHRQLDVEARYGEGAVVKVKVNNLSGKSESYTLTGLPLWITASKTAGTLPALGEETIELTVSPYINRGNFSEKIFLVGSGGMAEPLPINIKVRGDEPQWAVSNALKAKGITMHIVARVKVENEVMHDPDDIVAVFDENHQLLGVSYMDVDQTAAANEALAYLTVYNGSNKATPLHFEFFNASNGQIWELECSEGQYPEGIKFEANAVLGTSADPVLLSQTLYAVQTLGLKEGWNWLSFYVKPDSATVSKLLNQTTSWEVGDGFEVINGDGVPYLYTYKSKPHPDDPNLRVNFWDHGNDVVSLNPALMYRFFSKSDKTAYLRGFEYPASITVRKGWNRIAFSSSINLPIAVALAGYTDEGSEGDMIKSQDEFAVLNIVGGNRIWKGSLKYMRSGQGYMLKHNSGKEVKFWYPYYWSSSRYAGLGSADAPMRQPLFSSASATNMSVIAVTEGVDLQEGDRLVAYHGAEVCGVAEADEDGRFYLSVGESDNRATKDVQFSIERDGELVGLANQRMSYVGDAVVGSVNEPTVIRFVPAEGYADGEWYTLEGIRLSGRPAEKGVYIFNGMKVLVNE